MINLSRLIGLGLFNGDNLRYVKQFKPVVVWNITNRCNLNCSYCYNSLDYQDNKDLTLKEALAIVDNILSYGISVLIFSGGEPLLWNGLLPLARYVSRRGIPVALSTNGTLITLAVAEKLKKAGFSYVGISLDGPSEVNNFLRGSPNAFTDAIRAIRSCKMSGIRVGLRVTLTTINFKNIEDIFSLAKKEGINRICFYHLMPVGRAKDNFNELSLNFEDTRKVVENILENTIKLLEEGRQIEVLTVNNPVDGIMAYLKLKEIGKHKLAKEALQLLAIQGGAHRSEGRGILSLDNKGNLYVNQFWMDKPIGNLKEKSLKELWDSKECNLLISLRKKEEIVPKKCKECIWFIYCGGGIRKRAWGVGGQLDSEDPACFLCVEEIKKLK